MMGRLSYHALIVYNRGSVDMEYSGNYKDDFQKLTWTTNGTTTGYCATYENGGNEVIHAEIDRLVESL